MPITPTPKIWMNGELVDWDQARIHVLTHTLHYGMGVFEGIRAYETAQGPAVFRLTDHIVRMQGGYTEQQERCTLGSGLWLGLSGRRRPIRRWR